jgi:pimeloyl-ACP methyl ester carboxylesterase
MNSGEVSTQQATFAVEELGAQQTSHVQLIFGHGWGQSGAAFRPLAEILRPFAASSLIDFPGFGKSSLPPETWGTAEYADAVAGWMRTLPASKFIWIGHSFGGRVGIQLAARNPGLLAGMVLIAAAGLQRQRGLMERARMKTRVMAFKVAKRFVREGPQLDGLRARFGSADYRLAGAMRPIFVRVVREDLTNEAKRVDCPTLLIYGTRDTETPPEMGQRLSRLIPRSELALVEGFTHLSILTDGRHQVAMKIRRFLEQIER